MESNEYAFSARPTRNPFRYALAVWRLIRNDPTKTTPDAALVEMAFARSKRGRRFARWEETVTFLKDDPRTSEAVRVARIFGRIELSDLENMPVGTLGRVLADHCRARQVDPNLIQIPPTGDVGWLLNTLYQTHDIWHVVTGWGMDLEGEVGLGGFYCAQLGTPPFFGYMLALIFLNVVSRRADSNAMVEALSNGYRAGRRAQPLIGVAWDELWTLPLSEVRSRLSVDSAEIIGEGIFEAA